MKASKARNASSSKHWVGRGAGAVGAAVGTAVFWKQEHALLIVGVLNPVTKLGSGRTPPTGSARKLGQKSRAWPVKASKARKASSSKHWVGRGAGAPVGNAVGTAVFWKQEQALLIVGVLNPVTKLGSGRAPPTGSARKLGQKSRAWPVKASKARKASSSKH